MNMYVEISEHRLFECLNFRILGTINWYASQEGQTGSRYWVMQMNFSFAWFHFMQYAIQLVE